MKHALILLQLAYVTALFPYVGLFTLLGKGSTLPGADKGIEYFITPQWDKIGDAEVSLFTVFCNL